MKKILIAASLVCACVTVFLAADRVGLPTTQPGVVPITAFGGSSSGVIVGDELVLTTNHGTKAGGAAGTGGPVLARTPLGRSCPGSSGRGPLFRSPGLTRASSGAIESPGVARPGHIGRRVSDRPVQGLGRQPAYA